MIEWSDKIMEGIERWNKWMERWGNGAMGCNDRLNGWNDGMMQ